MMRKKITNKDKFQFREEEIISPPPLAGRNSFQSRLAKKADYKMTQGHPSALPSSGSSNDSRQGAVRRGDYRHGPIQVGGLNNQKSGGATTVANSQQPRSQDPILAEIVAKLKSGLQLDLNSQSSGESVHPRSAMVVARYQANSNQRMPPQQSSLAPGMQEKPSLAVKDCVCFRPLKLVMCEVCGETFRGRVSLACYLHPRALYLQDVKECKGCKQGNKEALKEFDLPPGMEIRKPGEKNMRGVGMN